MGTTCCSSNTNTNNTVNNQKPQQAVVNSQSKQAHPKAVTNTQITTEKTRPPEENPRKEEKLISIKFIYEGVPIEMHPVTVPETELFCNAIYSVINSLPQFSDYSYKDNQNEDIDLNKTIEEAFKKGNEDYHSIVQTVNVVYEGLDIPCNYQDIVNQYASKTTLIACPIPNSNPFEFRIFFSENLTLTKATLSIEEYPELAYFGDFSAYCNGNNYLYLSGGEELKDGCQDFTMENKYLSWMAKINLIDGKLTKLDSFNSPRFWHSMIYVPNRYVFIVGGNFTKSVEILNTDTGEITEDSILNDFHSEPSLCLVNENYLYCFMGFKYEGDNNYSNIIERCNLRMKKRTWEVVSLQNSEPCEINTRFFTVSYFNDDNLLLFGGDCISISKESHEESKPAYLYNKRTDSIKEYKAENFEIQDIFTDLFSEKFFIPMKNENSLTCILPKQTSDKLKVYLILNGNQLEIKGFEEETNQSSTQGGGQLDI